MLFKKKKACNKQQQRFHFCYGLSVLYFFLSATIDFSCKSNQWRSGIEELVDLPLHSAYSLVWYDWQSLLKRYCTWGGGGGEFGRLQNFGQMGWISSRDLLSNMVTAVNDYVYVLQNLCQ